MVKGWIFNKINFLKKKKLTKKLHFLKNIHMGNGCSHPTDRFSQYQKIHSKVQKNIPPRPSFKSNLEKKKTLETAAKSPTDQKKVVETIRLYTSNTFYEHLKKGKSLKELIPLSSNENSPFLDLIEEMRLYVSLKKPLGFP